MIDDQETMDNGEREELRTPPMQPGVSGYLILHGNDRDVGQVLHNDPVVCFKKRDEGRDETGSHRGERRLYQEERQGFCILQVGAARQP
jgi:hypothetical protein